MGKMDSMKGVPLRSGGKMPAGAASSDNKGERHERMVGGVAMGKEDMTGADKQFNTGKTSGICYVKEKAAYR